MTRKYILLIICSIGLLLPVFQTKAQENYKGLSLSDSAVFYTSTSRYEVTVFEQASLASKPKNIVLMIGDGMGLAQVSAALFANGGNLYLNQFKHCGFSQTQSASDFITDSSAGGTALSTGQRTQNGYVAVDTAMNHLTTILEFAENYGKRTGLVATSAITHATPAAFIAHQSSRNSYESIALDFIKTDIDVFIGGGLKYFENRTDGLNLCDSLTARAYYIFRNLNDIPNQKPTKFACLAAAEHTGRLSQRSDFLPRATQIAIEALDNEDQGFFLMIEGSQIDWGGHQNDTRYIIEETLDFDQSIGEALKFASANGETLIVVTADHETGGMSLIGGNQTAGQLHCAYSTSDHSGIMVPIFAYGPGASNFSGIMHNTDIFKAMYKLLCP